MKQLFSWFMLTFCSLVIVSCSDKDSDEPTIPTQDVAQNIVGTWLLSSSNANDWISYEFTETSLINAEIADRGYHGTGSGYYSINNENFSGNYTTDRNRTYYVDWIVSAIKPFEISIKIYDDNKFVGDAAIYRVLYNFVSLPQPEYSSLCGTSDVSNFSVLDNSIAEIDGKTGEITPKKAGITFATFDTPDGKAAIKITVPARINNIDF